MQENARRIAETATKRLLLIAQANGMWRFEEESEHEGDEYTGRYFAPTHVSGLYESAAAAEREARAILPWLRDQPEG
jgi:hypothetical protein